MVVVAQSMFDILPYEIWSMVFRKVEELQENDIWSSGKSAIRPLRLLCKNADQVIYDILPKCKKCKGQLVDFEQWGSDIDGSWGISCEERNLFCRNCKCHHILCSDCNVYCQLLGHGGLVASTYKCTEPQLCRMLRPNRILFEKAIEYSFSKDDDSDDDLYDVFDDVDTTGLEYMKDKDRRTLLNGGVDSPDVESCIPFYVGDLDLFYCSVETKDYQNLDKMCKLFTTPISNDDPDFNKAISNAQYGYKKCADENSHFLLNGPDGGYATIWKCPKCKHINYVTDK